MIDRYSISASADLLRERFSVDVPDFYKPKYNAAPTQLFFRNEQQSENCQGEQQNHAQIVNRIEHACATRAAPALLSGNEPARYGPTNLGAIARNSSQFNFNGRSLVDAQLSARCLPGINKRPRLRV